MAKRRFWGVVAGVLVAALLMLAAPVWAEAPPVAYVNLKYDLVRHGLDKGFVFRTFDDPRDSFLPDVVRKIAFLRKESKDIYAKFLTPAVAAQGRDYLSTHRAALSRAEAQYGVAPEVIVGILTVESGLGSNTGKYPVFNVFASLAVMDSPEISRELGLESAGRDRLKKKAAWARRELQVFLEYCAARHLDPYSYCGSWAGAMGFCQFLPSSLKSCGVSASGKGPVDLFTHDDAIFSIACYLKKSGFKLQNRASWRRAVLSYNHSDAYADTILTLAGWY
ncbi:MAG: lytic murein transglycosylase [Deltaproteobacteria bacterium]|nr:lytic murein transglycosylase [Deltaproteobacteria bacterium]